MPTTPSSPHDPSPHSAEPADIGSRAARRDDHDAATDTGRTDTGRTDTGAIVWADAEPARAGDGSPTAPSAAADNDDARPAKNAPPPPAQGVSPVTAPKTPQPAEPTPPEAAQPTDAPTPQPGWKVASLAGIPIYIGGGWVVIAIAMIFLFGPQIRSNMPELGARAYLVALVYAGLLLVSVLVHEGAHAVTARLCGYRVHRVVADLMGGHTSYDAAQATAGHSALIAVVGPSANALLALGGYMALPLADTAVSTLLIAAFAWTNAFVAVFNMLPGLPLDGGFLVDALVWKATGKRHLGLIAAGWAGRLVTVAAVAYFVGVPLVRGEVPSLFTVVWTALIGAFLWMGAGRAVQTGRVRAKLAARDLADLVLDVTPVAADLPLSELPRIAAGPGIVVLMDSGHPLGVLDPAAVEAAVTSGRTGATLRSCLVAMPPTWRYQIEPGSHDLGPVVEAMVQRQIGALVLCDSAGRPHGILDGSRVDAAL